MINCSEFYNDLIKNEIGFFAGVPDSLLKDFCAYLSDNAGDNHIITANEGNAVALAAGHYMATSKVPVVYMQNSGIGNTINPLASLTSKDVYSIPMILMIGWRGEPGKKDEPQHVMQGRLTIPLLDTMEIDYTVLDGELDYNSGVVENAISKAKASNTPYALVVKKGTFEKYKLQTKIESSATLEREEAIELVTKNLTPKKDLILSTTGKISRELYEYREKCDQGGLDFLNVGSMGHVSQIALGVALGQENKNVYCFDGDGAALMHLGGLGIIGSLAPKNFRHIVFNNGAHDSVGGQPTIGYDVDFLSIAKGLGYKECFKASSESELNDYMVKLKSIDGPVLLEIIVKPGARDDLGRPKTTPMQNKNSFMETVSE